MRGVAVLAAAGAGWTLAGGLLPALPRLSIAPPSARTLALTMATGLSGGLLALGLTAVPAAAIAVGILCGGGPLVAAGLQRARGRARTVDLWPDFLAVLRGELAGGQSLPEAFAAAASRSGRALGQAAERAAEAAATGLPFSELLAELRGTFADPIADRVLIALASAHRTGGQRVGAMLGALSLSVADELRLRKAHYANLTQQRLTAAVALVAPWILLVFTVTTNPSAAGAYRTRFGAAVVAGGLVATLLGYGLALRTARLSEAPRVFR